MTDAALDVVLPARGKLEGLGATIPFADFESYTSISDKRIVLERGAGIGIAVPEQITVPCTEALDTLDLAALRWPMVVKPSRSVAGSGGARLKTEVRYAHEPGELRRMLRDAPAETYPVLLQERITGPGVGMFLLVWGGALVAAFGHRRLREKPPSGGVSVLRESAPLDVALLERSAALLAAFDWRGPAMVEYKVDERSGTPYLMEINGRYWGSLQLAIDAGVDFPAIHMEVAAGREPPPVGSYAVGVKTRWMLGDLDHLIARLRRSPEELGLPPSTPGRARAVLDFLAGFGPGTREEILRWSDPFPALAELRTWLRPRR
jgi:predicted ATP-grasp superfamily ATP-dependent carboligase